MKLYTYWRSTASYRVRIALELKGIDVELVPVHLLADEGQQHSQAYSAINPGNTVPTLVLDDGDAITQSLAIVSYLDEIYPEPALLPADLTERARVRSGAQMIACDIHPLNNLRITQYLKQQLGHDDRQTVEWMKHWMQRGLAAYQNFIRHDAEFSFGGKPGLADICLVSQLYNAHRWGLDLTGFPHLVKIEKNCMALSAFRDSHPDRQPDVELTA